ncbi:MAG: amidohydrolase family protein [Chloroflexi bacterium]|nr:amidohydrolase family protein [Chloroflexota bacterium]
MTDLLLTHATIVTMDPARTILDDGAVAIAGNRIEAVGPTDAIVAGRTAARTLDCRGRVIIPGLIDAHGHGGHSLLKTLGCDTPALWMRIVTPTYFHFTTPQFWYVDGLVSALERLRAGVTTGVSVIGSQPRSDDPAFGINHARAYGEVGLREVVCVGPCHTPWPHPVSRWDSGRRERRNVTLDEALAGAEAVIEACHHAQDDRIRAFITPFTIVPSVDPSNPSTPDIATALTPHDRLQARRVREIAAKWRTRIHSDAFAGMVRMAAQDHEHALLGPDVHLQHCIDLATDEVATLAATGTHVSHAPGGLCPVPAMLQAGITVAVTTDGTAPRRSFDLLQAARGVQFAHQVRERDRYLLPPGKLLEMITIDAARVLGWDDDLGSLEPGKKADLAILNFRQPHLAPNWMVVHRLIYEAVGHDVETVIVDGRVVMEDRRVLTVDEPAALDMADDEARAIVARAGLEPHLTSPGWGKVRLTFDAPVPLPE